MAEFLRAQGPNGDLWASIDGQAHHLEGRVCQTRFGSYCAPYESTDAARAALIDAGCDPATISGEIRPKRARRG